MMMMVSSVMFSEANTNNVKYLDSSCSCLRS